MKQKQTELIEDYLNYLDKKTYSLPVNYNKKGIDLIIDGVSKYIEIYYPTRPLPISKEGTVFSEVNEIP